MINFVYCLIHFLSDIYVLLMFLQSSLLIICAKSSFLHLDCCLLFCAKTLKLFQVKLNKSCLDILFTRSLKAIPSNSKTIKRSWRTSHIVWTWENVRVPQRVRVNIYVSNYSPLLFCWEHFLSSIPAWLLLACEGVLT